MTSKRKRTTEEAYRDSECPEIKFVVKSSVLLVRRLQISFRLIESQYLNAISIEFPAPFQIVQCLMSDFCPYPVARNEMMRFWQWPH